MPVITIDSRQRELESARPVFADAASFGNEGAALQQLGGEVSSAAEKIFDVDMAFKRVQITNEFIKARNEIKLADVTINDEIAAATDYKTLPDTVSKLQQQHRDELTQRYADNPVIAQKVGTLLDLFQAKQNAMANRKARGLVKDEGRAIIENELTNSIPQKMVTLNDPESIKNEIENATQLVEIYKTNGTITAVEGQKLMAALIPKVEKMRMLKDGQIDPVMTLAKLQARDENDNVLYYGTLTEQDRISAISHFRSELEITRREGERINRDVSVKATNDIYGMIDNKKVSERDVLTRIAQYNVPNKYGFQAIDNKEKIQLQNILDHERRPEKEGKERSDLVALDKYKRDALSGELDVAQLQKDPRIAYTDKKTVLFGAAVREDKVTSKEQTTKDAANLSVVKMGISELDKLWPIGKMNASANELRHAMIDNFMAIKAADLPPDQTRKAIFDTIEWANKQKGPFTLNSKIAAALVKTSMAWRNIDSALEETTETPSQAKPVNPPEKLPEGFIRRNGKVFNKKTNKEQKWVND